MSSIIACSSPVTSGASGTRWGVLPRLSMPSACASRFAGSIVSTTTVRPYSAARSAMAAAVVVLPTPPAPQHTTTRLEVSDRIVCKSSARGAVLIGALCSSRKRSSPNPLGGKRFGEFVQTSEIDTVADRRQLEPRNVEIVELLGTFGAGSDASRVLDALGEQAREVGVGQVDARLGQTGPHRVGVDVALGGLGEVLGREIGGNVAVDD